MRFLQRKLLKTSKGIMLLDLIISMGMATIIISIVIPIFLRFNYLYNRTVVNDRNYFYAQEALLFIKGEISKSSLKCEAENNKIKISKLDGTKQYIYFVNTGAGLGDIVVNYYSNGSSSTVNNILRNVKEFKFMQKNNVIYIYIITSDGKKFERCLALNP